ncbi:RNA polymerase sigma factor [Paenibacillus sp. JX-17]|uniref:RNA polymerase sigma factor n=1 Tax=Paenibacillus lacisoli TaxID=3064525 RepID=A0ABT9C803_9BACL|nr:RNA polymerase sigma factor [Paenibacillus sp. JX-17]MDO7905020.1 RNA polymerase sigma factor [Paenibacillus sp. JX-17]
MNGKEGRAIEHAALIQQILQGDRSKFRELVEMYSNHIYHVAYSVLHDAKEAEDAAQEALIQVYKSLPQYRNEGFKTWISRIALHKAIDAKRKKARQTANNVEFDQTLLEATLRSDEPDVLAQLVRSEHHDEIRRRVEELPPKHREIITAFYLEGKGYDQISIELEVAAKTVESRLYRARQWIREHWKEEEWI